MSSFGNNNQSWYFGVKNENFQAWHGGHIWSSRLPADGCRRVGVYVDWPGGSVSFYRVSSNTLIHLYTFRDKFTEALHPGFYVYHKGNFASFKPIYT